MGYMASRPPRSSSVHGASAPSTWWTRGATTSASWRKARSTPETRATLWWAYGWYFGCGPDASRAYESGIPVVTRNVSVPPLCVLPFAGAQRGLVGGGGVVKIVDRTVEQRRGFHLVDDQDVNQPTASTAATSTASATDAPPPQQPTVLSHATPRQGDAGAQPTDYAGDGLDSRVLPGHARDQHRLGHQIRQAGTRSGVARPPSLSVEGTGELPRPPRRQLALSSPLPPAEVTRRTVSGCNAMRGPSKCRRLTRSPRVGVHSGWGRGHHDGTDA